MKIIGDINLKNKYPEIKGKTILWSPTSIQERKEIIHEFDDSVTSVDLLNHRYYTKELNIEKEREFVYKNKLCKFLDKVLDKVFSTKEDYNI